MSGDDFIECQLQFWSATGPTHVMTVHVTPFMGWTAERLDQEISDIAGRIARRPTHHESDDDIQVEDRVRIYRTEFGHRVVDLRRVDVVHANQLDQMVAATKTNIRLERLREKAEDEAGGAPRAGFQMRGG